MVSTLKLFVVLVLLRFTSILFLPSIPHALTLFKICINPLRCSKYGHIYWQGDPVSNGCWCLQWTWLCYWQRHPVSRKGDCLIDRVTLSAVGVDTCSGRDCVIDSVTLSAVKVIVLLTGWPCQQWVLIPAVDVIVLLTTTLSAVGVDALLQAQQWVLIKVKGKGAGL